MPHSVCDGLVAVLHCDFMCHVHLPLTLSGQAAACALHAYLRRARWHCCCGAGWGCLDCWCSDYSNDRRWLCKPGYVSLLGFCSLRMDGPHQSFVHCVAGPFLLVAGPCSCDMNTNAQAADTSRRCLLAVWFVSHEHCLLSGTTLIARARWLSFSLLLRLDDRALAQEQVCC
jgi:hypothetical protein